MNSQKAADVHKDGVVEVVAGTTTYQFTFTDLLPGTCYSLEVVPVKYCNTTDLDGSTVTASNYSGDSITITECTGVYPAYIGNILLGMRSNNFSHIFHKLFAKLLRLTTYCTKVNVFALNHLAFIYN